MLVDARKNFEATVIENWDKRTNRQLSKDFLKEIINEDYDLMMFDADILHSV
jgi:hypothetical protein